MKLVYQYMAIFFNFSLTSNHLHPLQVENCDSNSRLVLNEDDNDSFRLQSVKHLSRRILVLCHFSSTLNNILRKWNVTWNKNTGLTKLNNVMSLEVVNHVEQLNKT